MALTAISSLAAMSGTTTIATSVIVETISAKSFGSSLGVCMKMATTEVLQITAAKVGAASVSTSAEKNITLCC